MMNMMIPFSRLPLNACNLVAIAVRMHCLLEAVLTVSFNKWFHPGPGSTSAGSLNRENGAGRQL